MPVNMSKLNNTANAFSAIGKNYVSIDVQTHQIGKKTETGLQRLVAWMKSGGSGQRTENRAILNSIKADVSRTLGDRYEAAFQDKIQSSFNSRRPIAGRKVAAALQEVMQMKKNDDNQALQTALQSNKAYVTTSPEARQVLQTAIAERAAQYHLDPQSFNTKKIQDNTLTLLNDDSSLTLKAASQKKMASSIQSFVSKMALDLFENEMIKLATNTTPAVGDMLQTAMRNHGFEGKISQQFISALCNQAGAKLSRGARVGKVVTPPTPEKVQNAVKKVVDKTIASMQAVQSTPLNASGKTAMMNSILKSREVIDPGVVQVSALILSKNNNLATLTRLFGSMHQENDTVSLKQDIMSMQKDFNETFKTIGHAAGLGGEDGLNVGEFILNTALQHQTGGKDLAKDNGSGALLVRTLYDISFYDPAELSSNTGRANEIGQVSFVKELLTAFRHSGNEDFDKLIADPQKPPLEYATRHHLDVIAQSHGKI